MMKKKYVIPSTSVVEVKTESLMHSASSWSTDNGQTSDDIIYGGGEITGEDDQWVRGQNQGENPTGAKSFNVWE